MFGLAHGVFVADEKRTADFITEFQEVMVGITAEDKPDVAFLQSAGDCGNALIKETIMAQVGVRIKRNRREENYTRDTESVGGCNCSFEGRVVMGAMGALHPVNDAFAGRVAGLANGDARVGGEMGEVHL